MAPVYVPGRTVTFYYDVYCMEKGCYPHTGGILGGGKIEQLADSEEGFVRAYNKWTRHHPHHEIHIEEITAEQYSS